MSKVIRKVIEIAVAVKDGAIVVVFLLALVLRHPARQRDDVKTVLPGRVPAKGEPRPQGAFPDHKRFDLWHVGAEPLI